jgi:hypothetical protein
MVVESFVFAKKGKSGFAMCKWFSAMDLKIPKCCVIPIERRPTLAYLELFGHAFRRMVTSGAEVKIQFFREYQGIFIGPRASMCGRSP